MSGNRTRTSGAISQIVSFCPTYLVAFGLTLLTPMPFRAAHAEPDSFSILICGSDGCFDPVDGSMPGSEPLRTYSILFSDDTKVCSSLAKSLNSTIRAASAKPSRQIAAPGLSPRKVSASIFVGGSFVRWHRFTAWHPEEITSSLAAGRYRGDDAQQVSWTVVPYFNDGVPIVVTRGGDWSGGVVSWLSGAASIDALDWGDDLSYAGLVSPAAPGFGRCGLYKGEPLQRANLFKVSTPSCLKDKALQEAAADVGSKAVKTIIFFLKENQKILVAYAAGQFDSVYVAELTRRSIKDVCLLKSNAKLIVNNP